MMSLGIAGELSWCCRCFVVDEEGKGRRREEGDEVEVNKLRGVSGSG